MTNDLTGYFVRIERGGEWISADITSLTDAELDAYLATQDVARLPGWVKALAGWIRDNVAPVNE